MSRIMGIDYGLKRIGIAVTDPLQMIATSLTTITKIDIYQFLKKYLKKEEVIGFVVGIPKNLNNTNSAFTYTVLQFIHQLKIQFPQKKIYQQDERYTSKIALQSLIDANTTKKYRRNKKNIDKTSAVIILQSFLEQKNIQK